MSLAGYSFEVHDLSFRSDDHQDSRLAPGIITFGRRSDDFSQTSMIPLDAGIPLLDTGQKMLDLHDGQRQLYLSDFNQSLVTFVKHSG